MTEERPAPAEPRHRRRWRLGGVTLLIVIGVVVVVFGVAGAGLWHLSTSPKLCNSCL